MNGTIDWTKSMQRTYEYYLVDPNTWCDVKKLTMVKTSSIDWDLDSDTLGSQSISIDEHIGEAYVRTYMIINQNGVEHKRPMGTFLVQTPGMFFDGKTKEYSADAYTPLIELKEKYPEIGHFEEEKTVIMDRVYMLTRENLRAPVIKPDNDEVLIKDFIADPNADMLEYVNDLMTNAKYEFDLDEMGRVIFKPKQDIAALQPVWTFDDGNSSILLPNINLDEDLYGIPNSVEVVCSTGSTTYRAVVRNEDADSPVSIKNRGRVIPYRETNPSIVGTATQEKIQEYAELLLRELSTIERTITYTHAYCPVRIGDCIRLNYSRAGLTNIKAKIISQSIPCTPDCPVTETAVYTTKLWKPKKKEV